MFNGVGDYIAALAMLPLAGLIVAHLWVNKNERAELAKLTCPDCERALGSNAVRKGRRHDFFDADSFWEFTCPHCGLHLTAQRSFEECANEAMDHVFPGSRARGPYRAWPVQVGDDTFPDNALYCRELVGLGQDPDDFQTYALAERLRSLPAHPLHGVRLSAHGRPNYAKRDLIVRIADTESFAYVRLGDPDIPCKVFDSETELNAFLIARRHINPPGDEA